MKPKNNCRSNEKIKKSFLWQIYMAQLLLNFVKRNFFSN